MKEITSILLCLAFLIPIFCKAGEESEISKRLELKKLDTSDLANLRLKAEAAFIFTILANTQELRIHQMGGATNNQVFLSGENGRYEIVVAYDRHKNGDTGKHVNDCLNKGSLNYYHPYATPLGHFTADILPWLTWGNCKDDPSSLNQRIEAYMSDFREGYIRAINKKEGFYLPEKFNFEGSGQSEAVSFFKKATELSKFNMSDFLPKKIHEKKHQEEFFKAIEKGMKILLKHS